MTRRRAITRGTQLLIGVVVVLILGVGTILVAMSTQNPSSSGDGASTQGSNSSGRLYQVSFEQVGACSPEFWGIPWSVTIDGVTEVQPPGTQVPISNSTLYGTTNETYTSIVFSLPDGTYNYRVSPSNFFFTPDSGSISVSGSDLTVKIAYTGTSCTATATSSSSMSVPEFGPVFIHVLNDSTLAAVGGISVTAGPASSKSDVVFTPGGPTVSECVHEIGSGSTVYGNGTVVSGTTTYTLAHLCHLSSYVTNATGWVSIPTVNSSFLFIRVGTIVQSTYDIVGLNGSGAVYVTMPWPSGVASVSTNPPSSAGHSQVTGQVYKVAFQQKGWCTPPVYTAPWEVTLGNETEVEPSNATLPIPTNTATESGAFQKYSTIAFSVPDGTYAYTVQIAGVQPTSGIVVVSGSDVTIGTSGLPPACVATPTQPSALKLNLNLSEGATNPGSASPDYAIDVNASEFNTLTTYNYISAVQSWPNANLSLGPCGTFEFPFVIVLYQGYYKNQNISSGTSLTIYTPNANTTSAPRPEDCPAKPDVFSYDFAPQSDNAIVNLTWAGDNTSTTYSLSDSVSIIGYWSGSSGTEAFHPLNAGVYTVLAGDEWGNTVLQYITIE